MQLSQILELFAQPVFIVQEDTITWCNSAARLILVEGSSLSAILDRAIPLFSLWERQGILQVPLSIDGALYDAAVLATEQGDVFVVTRRNETPDTTANAVLSTAANLRATLHGMLAATEEIFEKTEDMPDLRKASSQLNHAFYRLLRLSGQLSESGQLLSHRRMVRCVPTNLYDFLEDFVYNARPLVESVKLELEYLPPDASIRVAMDTDLLELALYNLLSNAMRYTPRGGKITLAVERQRRLILFHVNDNGEGISSNVFSTLLTRFSSQKLGDSRWGVGFGLSIVREVAQIHGGSMIVDSAVGQGTRVTFSISTDPAVLTLRSPALQIDDSGSFHRGLVALSDALDAEMYDPSEI